MDTDVIAIVAIVSIVLWLAVSRELVKAPKEKNGLKLMTLISVGTLSTVIVTISLFQNTFLR
ncbi:hypothetical protein [Ureibacillus sinduriensis]|uniref:Uncharacterized protein n=1 Tax=Ureibacillus sinduriensis BLB-1 = JCM 15800 TaxID=1384057 RepID=A0A0A3HZU0_9BACL|nr:hypothetical protein [Ureibacillus sinduriensis]KGR77964.1 hypothetical protein CD33_01955 [Ureibacillus sinduriensis BLB-1 = JCM 15800]